MARNCFQVLARAKIKQWFKKEKREENIIHGRAAFESELKQAGLSMAAVTDEEILPNIIKKLAVTSLDDVFAAIGYGGITATRAVNRIRDEILKSQRPAQKTTLDRINESAERRRLHVNEKNAVHGVLVEGLDNCLVKFSKCCTPVPGDDIVGFITRGFGVSVHRRDCNNYLANKDDPKDGGRWVNVSWITAPGETYITTIKIIAKERGGLVMDIAMVLNAMSAKVVSLSARDIDGGRSTAVITLEVKELDDLKAIIARLSTISGVMNVSRAGDS